MLSNINPEIDQILDVKIHSIRNYKKRGISNEIFPTNNIFKGWGLRGEFQNF